MYIIHILFFTAISALIPFSVAQNSAQYLMDADGVLGRDVQERLIVLLKEHTQLTDETVGISFLDSAEKQTPALAEAFFRWTPSTKKPTNSVLIRIKKGSGDFEIFSGAGLGALLGSDGIDSIRDLVEERVSAQTAFDQRVEILVNVLLSRIESPLPISIGPPLKNDDSFEVSPFPLWSLFLVLGSLFLICAAALYKLLFSEIHLGAFLEKRISPFHGKFRRTQLEKDLITGGGISGSWDS